LLSALKNLRLSAKISLLGAGSVLITAVALVALAVWQSGQYNTLAQHEVDTLINADLDHIMQGVYNLVQTENEAVQQQVDYNLKVARHVLASAGRVSLSKDTVPWTAINQFTHEPTEVHLPKLLVGHRWLGQNADPTVETAIVDDVQKLVGDTATIFQRMNERGDMLRVATTVKTLEGRRAIGTYIPAIDPGGTPNPVIATVRQLETYHGRAFVVNAWYLTAYEPITDSAGDLVGMLYVGVKQQAVESRVRQAILQTTVGKTGYVFVLSGTGKDRGHYVISKDGLRDGENIWESKDAEGRYFIQAIIQRALALKPGEMATERYPWQNMGESSPRWKIARFAYYAPWDWVIGTSAYEDELQGYQALLSGGRKWMTSIMALAGLAITLVIVVVGVLIARTIARPVRQMTEAVKTIIQGNLNQAVDIRSRDEIGILTETFNFMADKLTQTLEGLRKSEQRLHAILQGSPIPAFVIDKNHRVMHWNRALQELSGITSEEVMGTREHWRAFYTRERPCMADLLVDERSEAIPSWYPGKCKRSDLSPDAYEATDFFPELGEAGRWLRFTAAAIRDPEGRIVGAVETLEDISESKRAEQALRESEEQYRSLFSGVPVGLYRSTPAGRIVDGNPALVEMFGYPSRESLLAVKTLDLYVDPDDRARWVTQLEREGTVRNFEVKMRRFDGTVIDVLNAGRIVRDKEGRVLWYEGSVEDITERKRAEEERSKLETQLRHAQKMEAVGQLAGGVAHDFNNILTAILGNAELIMRDLELQLPPNHLLIEELRVVERSALRGAGLTRQLLAFSRQQLSKPAVIDLNRVLLELDKMLRSLLKEDIHLSLNVSPESMCIWADPGQIEQVVVNLVVNARDAMPSGGQLVVETSKIVLSPSDVAARDDARPGAHVVLTVSDTGIGMTRETMERIFEPFYTTKPLGEGTGLGLAMVYGIVKQAGGHITVQSEPGVGTWFRIHFPVVDATPSEMEAPGGRHRSPSGTETILICEDSEPVLNLAVEILRSGGYTVLAAGNGEQALRLAKQHDRPIHLLLTDVVMPGMDGKKLADTLTAIMPNLKTLFISGYASDVIARRGVLEEGLELLEKPFTHDGLLRRVRGILDREPRQLDIR